jgi:hypothetical protein
MKLKILALLIMLAAMAVMLQPRDALAQSKMLVGHEVEVQKNNHGVGVALDPKGGLMGFAYRHYFGNTALQIDALPLYADRGDYLAMFFGVQAVNYALVWSGTGRGSVLPATTALRLTGGLSMRAERDQATSTIEVDIANCQTQACKDIVNAKPTVTYMASAAAGFGFEFGAIQRSGFSLAADLMMTVLWDDIGFYGAYPLPYATLMYSW